MALYKFTKMHSYGNDFVIFDFRNNDKILSESEIIYLADRNFGIGCDQILIIYKSQKAEEEKASYVNVKIYNQDGTEAQNCGNGMRCIGGLLAKEITKPLLKIETLGGIIATKADPNLGISKANFGIPVVNGEQVDMGNKHKIIVVKDFENIDRKPDNDFNINYMQILSRNEIFVRTIERGVGETFCCGTGMGASVAYGIVNNLLDNKVNVKTRGTDIMDQTVEVTWQGAGKPMLQSGSYYIIFTGEIDF